MSFLKLRAIPYYPELSEKLGNEITASIVMTQLEYWFAKKGYAPFYKFLEPVSNKDAKGNEKSTFGYVEGDSWTEELNISKKSFKNAFSKIGVTYNTKSEFEKAEEKFKSGDTEFFYCCYTDKQTRQTYYYRNHKKVDNLCNEIASSKITYDEIPKPFPKDSKKLQKGISRSDERESLEVTKGNPSIIQEITSGEYNNKIMNHEEHDFFETLFKELGINFTTTNQESIKNLLINKNATKETVKEYLLETYENMKSNSSIKNLSGAFSTKIQTGKRQPKYQMKTKNQQAKNQEAIVSTIKDTQAIIEDKPLTQDIIAAEKEEKANLDTVFNSLPKQKQESIMSEALKIALAKSNGFEPFAKLMANRKIKYELLRQL